MPIWVPWVVFNALVLGLLFLDAKVLHRHSHEVKFKEAVGWSVFWIALAMVFMIPLYYLYEHYYDPVKVEMLKASGQTLVEGLGTLTGRQALMNYLTGYVVEKSLSVDNLFVFLLVFSYFRVPAKYHHHVLFYGILGAIVMRIAFILAGVALIRHLHWVMYLFGALLLFSGIKMVFKSEEKIEPDKMLVVRLMTKWLPVTHEYHEDRFFVRIDGRRMATLLFVVLMVVETTDLIFAVDSIPAILGITQDSFIVYTSNIFAILGLRALFFALQGMMTKFHLLHYGLSAILVFIGLKMVVETLHHDHLPGGMDIPTLWALGVILLILTVSVVGSLMLPKKEPTSPTPPPQA